MPITLPGSPIYDIASTTNAWMQPLYPVIVLGGGVFIGLFIIQFLIGVLANQWDSRHPQPPTHAPMM